jgi:putative hydrolase of the HAD superfamily
MYEDLAALIRDSSPPMTPAPAPPLPPDYEKLLYPGRRPAPLPGVRALIFDIYGTLFTSAAGDISHDCGYMRRSLDSRAASSRAASSLSSLDNLALRLGGACTGEELKEYFHSSVLKIHERLFAKTAYPEVRAEEIWAGFLKGLIDPGLKDPGLKDPGLLDPNASARDLAMSPEELAVRYELAVNPVYVMPGAGETIRALKEAGFVLGLISNAQFFTPLLFDAFLGASPAVLGFDQGLLIYSFGEGEAKPSPALFAKARRRLAELGIAPEAAACLGNDMLNDVYAASSAGFKTLLFAGDGRSLRLREDKSDIKKIRPDAVIRSLSDIPSLCGLPSREQARP